MQASKEMGKSIKFRQEVSECVQTYRLHRLCHIVLLEMWENQSISDNKEVSECVQTYRLHGLCHTVLFAGKGGDGQINQVQTTKRSVSVHKLTVCMDCATQSCLQAREEMGQSIKFRQEFSECVQTYRLQRLCHRVLLERWENQSISDNKEVSECVQTYRLHGLCHTVLFAGKEGDGKINQVQTTKRSVSVYKLTSCKVCATGSCLQAGKKIKSISDNKEVSVYKLTHCKKCAAGCCL